MREKLKGVRFTPDFDRANLQTYEVDFQGQQVTIDNRLLCEIESELAEEHLQEGREVMAVLGDLIAHYSDKVRRKRYAVDRERSTRFTAYKTTPLNNLFGEVLTENKRDGNALPTDTFSTHLTNRSVSVKKLEDELSDLINILERLKQSQQLAYGNWQTARSLNANNRPQFQ